MSTERNHTTVSFAKEDMTKLNELQIKISKKSRLPKITKQAVISYAIDIALENINKD